MDNVLVQITDVFTDSLENVVDSCKYEYYSYTNFYKNIKVHKILVVSPDFQSCLSEFDINCLQNTALVRSNRI